MRLHKRLCASEQTIHIVKDTQSLKALSSLHIRRYNGAYLECVAQGVRHAPRAFAPQRPQRYNTTSTV